MSLIMQKRDSNTIILRDKGAADITKFYIICGYGLRTKISF